MRILFVAAVLASSLPAQEAPQPFVQTLMRIGGLARFRSEVARVGSFSSYDRTGGNDDGFSGKYSFLRKEGDGLVIAELEGAGALTRIWTATPSQDPIEFYFDGEASPRLRLPFADLFTGKTQPFVPPLAGAGAGGYYSYVPLEFARSIKVVVRAPKFQFYQINYVTYAKGTPVRTYRPGDSFQQPGVETAGRTVRGEHTLAPGKTVTVFETKRPGRIVSLRLGPAEALAGGDRAVVLRIFWDGATHPAVEVPACDFFGYSFGQPAARSLLMGSEDGWAYLRVPLPFDRSARIELTSDKVAGPPVTVRSEVTVSDRPRGSDELFFHTAWRRENPTTPGRPFPFLDVNGRGHVLGVLLQVQGEKAGQTLYFEGDDVAVIDGELAAHGTGSEDFFNGGWYDLPGRWYGRISFPFSGCLDYRKHLSRTGAYRLLLADAYSFRKSMLLTIEHGAVGNNVAGDYVGTTYYYLDRPEGAASRLAPVASRQTREPDSFAIVPGWQEPIYAFSFQNATLTKVREKLGGKDVRYLSLRQSGKPEMLGHFVAITAEAPVAGRYAISLEGLAGPDAGIVQMLVNGQCAGEKVDFYAPERGLGGVRKMLEMELVEGANQLFFGLAGQNPQSRGLGFDLVQVQCQRLK